jgi:hypothetical protein
VRGAFLLLVVLLTSPAAAQTLVFHAVPSSLRLAGRTGALTIERLAATGIPLTMGSLNVTVTSPLGGQVAPGPEPFSTWGATLSVNIPAGSSQSAPVYLRSGVRGVASWAATAPGFSDATATVLIRDDALTCDAETGTRLDTDVPPGPFNTLFAPYPQSSLNAVASAAHRGSFGLRLIDAESSVGGAADTALYDDGAPVFGDFHARAWVRVVVSNGVGAAIIAQLTNAQAQSPSLLDVKLQANLNLSIAGFGADAGYAEFTGDAGFKLARWQLLEFSVTGAGTADGGLWLWLDGTPLLSQNGVDFSGTRLSIGRLAIGEPYAADRLWQGTLDFDDVRSAGVPLASRLELRTPASGFVGECLPLGVELRATFGGGFVPAGEAVPVTLDAGGDVEFFMDNSCVVASDQGTLPPDASVLQVSFRAAQPTAVLGALTPDFLPATRALGLTVPSTLDVAPLLTRVGPGQVVNFIVTGGTGRGVGFRMVVNPSGGTVDPTGRYQAGLVTGGFDVVEASDSAGQTALGTVEVRAVDAGVVDAGVVDAGIVDAGVVDAGVVDAGVIDAGAPDAGKPGPQPVRSLGVGCGCSTGGELSLTLLFLLGWLRRGKRVSGT